MDRVPAFTKLDLIVKPLNMMRADNALGNNG